MSTYHGPLNPNPKDGEAGISIYGYIPGLALPIVGAITFFLSAAVNLWYIIKYRGYRSFHALLLVGSLMECGGYAARIYAHYRPFLISAFIAQYFLIVVAPVLFSAAIYLSLTLLVRRFQGSESLLPIKPRTVLIAYVTFDVICTIIQIAGAALIGTSESARVRGTYSRVTPEQANDILTAGLAIQTFSFLTFLVLVTIALSRSYRLTDPTADLGGTAAAHNGARIHKMLWVILITSTLILLRTIFRLAETAQGFFGTAATSETLFACLEFLPVILALVVWNVFPPARLIGDGEQRRGLVNGRAMREKGVNGTTAV